MQRLFGISKPTPKATLDEAMTKVDVRIASVDQKVHLLNVELAKLSTLINSSSAPSTKAVYRKKAMGLLQQRKQFTDTRDQLMQQSFNMEQAMLMKGNLENTMVTIDAMKTTTKQLERQYGKVRISDIEKIHDKMDDMKELGDEIQQAMNWSSTYGVPDELDDAELDAELDLLETTIQMEKESGLGSAVGDGRAEQDAGLTVPDYLLDVPLPPTKPVVVDPDRGMVKEAAR